MGLDSEMTGRMSGDKFHIIHGPLTFSSAKLDIEADPFTAAEGTFTVYGPTGRSVQGFVSSSSVSMQCVTGEFSGSADEIVWRFDSTAYSIGDIIDGYFRIISNQGEYKLPFEVTIKEKAPMSSKGAVNSPEAFAALAKTDWKEAVSVFYSPEFEGIFTDEDTEARALYHGLKSNSGNEQNVEEFLISSNCKMPQEFMPETSRICTDLRSHAAYNRTEAGGIDDPVAISATSFGDPVNVKKREYYFRIIRNGWGYTDLTVTSDCAFIIPVNSSITQDDFDGTSAEVHYYVDPAMMHDGRNMGSISIRGAWCDLKVPIEAFVHLSTMDAGFLNRKELEQIKLLITRYYVDFRSKKMRGKEWLSQTEVLVNRLRAIAPDDPIGVLYKAHCDITAGRQRDAAWELADFDRRVEETLGIPSYSDPGHRVLEKSDPLLYSYRVYLGAICADDENTVTAYDSAERLETELNKYPDNWRIAWLYIYCSPEFRKKPRRKWEIIRQQFATGAKSPVLFCEAWALIDDNPEFLSGLDEFELEVIYYAAKRGLLNEQVMTQVNFLAVRHKTYSKLLQKILKAGYEQNLFVKETLLSICTLMIRGNMTSESCFEWYSRGVKNELTLTRLFEYYMLSLPEDYSGEIPQEVVMYFAYQCSLPYELKARLYAYVNMHRTHLSGIYEQYLPAISEFTMEMLSKRRVTPALCYLYEHVLDNTTLNDSNAADACVCIFACNVHTKMIGLTKIILCYDRLKSEKSYPMSGTDCMLPIFGDDVHIFFEDMAGNRYSASAKSTYDRLVRYGDIAPLISDLDTDNTLYDLYMTGISKTWYRITSDNFTRFRTLADSDELRESVRQEIRLNLLKYYDEHDLTRETDDFLENVRPEYLKAGERGEILFYLVQRGFNDKALGWVMTYGTYGADAAVLMRLMNRVIVREEPMYDAKLAEIIHEVFVQGKYDEKLLLYLERCFEGLASELDEIRHAAGRFDTDCTMMPGRMINQMLYTGVVLRDEEELITAAVASKEPKESVSALLAQISHYYFVNDMSFGREAFDRIGEYARKGVSIYDVSRMAYLRNLSKRSGEMSEQELATAKLFLHDLLKENIVFPFYRRFSGLLPELQEFADETLMQFKGRPEASVLLHYSVSLNPGAPTSGGAAGTDNDQVYKVQPMKEMYEGIYVAGFVLFFGEQVRYFVTDDAAQKNVVESGTFSQDTRISDAGEDRFGEINHISMLTKTQHYDEALASLEKYNRRAHMVQTLFRR